MKRLLSRLRGFATSMPYKSEKQRRYMYANHPEIAKKYEKEGKSNVDYSKKKPAAEKTVKRAAAAAKKAVKKGGKGK